MEPEPGAGPSHRLRPKSTGSATLNLQQRANRQQNGITTIVRKLKRAPRVLATTKNSTRWYLDLKRCSNYVLASKFSGLDHLPFARPIPFTTAYGSSNASLLRLRLASRHNLYVVVVQVLFYHVSGSADDHICSATFNIATRTRYVFVFTTLFLSLFKSLLIMLITKLK